MFRTRDFVLYFTAIIFLLMAIGYTALEQKPSSGSQQFYDQNVPAEILEVSAVITSEENVSLSREERLESLRQKIKDSELIGISEIIVADIDEMSTMVATSSGVVAAPLLCDSYNPYLFVNWPTPEIISDQVEGARQYYTTETILTGTTSSSTVKKTVLLTLSTNFLPLNAQTCLSSDVIGVALDGSLIRNNETSLYSIFSSESLIGYALDGFPIYGTGNRVVDECGGRIELGQYRYELSNERQTILNCFVGAPQKFQ